MTTKGRHASPDPWGFYKNLAVMIGGIILVGVGMFSLLFFFARGPSPTTTTNLPLTTSTTEATTTEPTTTIITTTTTIFTTTEVPVRPPGEVRVQVFNSMGRAGAAGRLTTRLDEAGYQTLPAGDYTPLQDPSRVWYRSGFSAEANVLLEFLPDALVEELPDPTVGEGADVVVVLGAGYQE